jgi:beta-1,4-mannosyl-glycoprotein beta-1,4-N-acetylglucosaminyltransferase
MPKTIDCFLFFQELDLLEIRLRYLYDVVDHFVVFEANQAFSGETKPFVFADNAQRFAPYADKICYFKLDEVHHSFDDVCNGLRRKGDSVSLHILDILETQSHFDRRELHWVLDQYHRECLLYPLEQIAQPDDLILFSDLDELPAPSAIRQAGETGARGTLSVFVCDEYDYFLNWFNFRGWPGAIGGQWADLKAHSLNDLRRLVRAGYGAFTGQRIERGGYHFTSCGGLAAVQRKIESWGHQEFNISLVKSRLQTNILYGRDVFFRGGTALRHVDVEDTAYFDPKLQAILLDYPHLIAAEPAQETLLSALSYRLDQAHFKVLRLLQKIKSVTRAAVLPSKGGPST